MHNSCTSTVAARMCLIYTSGGLIVRFRVVSIGAGMGWGWSVAKGVRRSLLYLYKIQYTCMVGLRTRKISEASILAGPWRWKWGHGVYSNPNSQSATCTAHTG